MNEALWAKIICNSFFFIPNLDFKAGRELCLMNASLIRYVLEKVMIRTRSRKTLKTCTAILLRITQRTRKSPDELVELARRDREACERLLVKALGSLIREGRIAHSSART